MKFHEIMIESVQEQFKFGLRTYISVQKVYTITNGAMRLLIYHIASFPGLPIIQAVFDHFQYAKEEERRPGASWMASSEYLRGQKGRGI